MSVKMLTINEAAQFFPGLTKYRIREMCINREISCIKAGRKYLICEQVLSDYLTNPTPLPIQEQGGIRRIES